jgi:hypothetical protein
VHHFRLNETRVNEEDGTFEIRLHNQSTGATITVAGPLHGAFQESGRRLGPEDLEQIGEAVADTLREATAERRG